MAVAAKRTRRGVKAFVDLWRGLFAEHNVLTWASAIAFQVLVALVPLTLLALGILGALGEQRVWKRQIRPPIEHRLSKPTFRAIDFAAEKILSHATLGLLTFGAVLTLWEVSGSVRAIGGALNQMYGAKETRGFWRRRSCGGTSRPLPTSSRPGGRSWPCSH